MAFQSKHSIRSILDIKTSVPEQEQDSYPTNSSNSSKLNSLDDEVSSGTRLEAHTKPIYTYSSLIFKAIRANPGQCMTLSLIVDWISQVFPYYQKCEKGWQNSIRHTLSVDKCFNCVQRSAGDTGRGNYWALDPSAEGFTVAEDTGRLRRNTTEKMNRVFISGTMSSNDSGFHIGASQERAVNNNISFAHQYSRNEIYFFTPEEMAMANLQPEHQTLKNYYLGQQPLQQEQQWHHMAPQPSQLCGGYDLGILTGEPGNLDLGLKIAKRLQIERVVFNVGRIPSDAEWSKVV